MVNASDLDEISDLVWRHKKCKLLVESLENSAIDSCSVLMGGDDFTISREETLRLLREIASTTQSSLYHLGVKI